MFHPVPFFTSFVLSHHQSPPFWNLEHKCLLMLVSTRNRLKTFGNLNLGSSEVRPNHPTLVGHHTTRASSKQLNAPFFHYTGTSSLTSSSQAQMDTKGRTPIRSGSETIHPQSTNELTLITLTVTYNLLLTHLK